jgi:hypothetical protein
MKTLLFAILTGLVVGGIGLVLEYYKVAGFCNKTGIYHLSFFESYFYALHSHKAVVISAFVLNLFLGILFYFIGTLAYRYFKGHFGSS